MYDSDDLKAGCLAGLLAIPFIVLLSFLTAGIATWLWGLIVVPVFGLPALGYWQMFGLIWLLRLILPTSVSSSGKN